MGLGREFTIAVSLVVKTKELTIMTSTYVTDLQHYLDGDGEIVAQMPEEARQLASFLALLVDEASGDPTLEFTESAVRCRIAECNGQIRASINASKEILWQCPICGHNGVIRNWVNTKWDQSPT
jgi:hypothetical protein